MPSISLSDLQNAVDKNYGDFVLDLPDGKSLTFIAILRLPKAKRDKLTSMSDRDIKTADDFMKFIQDFFETRAATPADFKGLKAICTDSPAHWTQFFELAAQVESAGEA